ncbi:hypothetical protein Mame_01290 [Martelella mediterranea DSM 17316]|uniref:Uncharacterized protein n=1 Tax=Martelella mediterranea DSM 17316 TaxID=1122214 RepID=A0A1U9YZ11_9HYPH|nr:hypothetical protein Mame_01290 [Martelella mediterranea DSM 17316]
MDRGRAASSRRSGEHRRHMQAYMGPSRVRTQRFWKILLHLAVRYALGRARSPKVWKVEKTRYILGADLVKRIHVSASQTLRGRYRLNSRVKPARDTVARRCGCSPSISPLEGEMPRQGQRGVNRKPRTRSKSDTLYPSLSLSRHLPLKGGDWWVDLAVASDNMHLCCRQQGRKGHRHAA